MKFILYGLIQGLTEFIPVSSTAHLKILSQFLGFNDPGSSLSAIIQIGSVFAIFWYFREEFISFYRINSNTYFSSVLSNKLFRSISLGTIPIVFLGGIIKLYFPQYSDSFFRSNLSIALVSILMAYLMFLADRTKNNFIKISNHSFLNSLLIGFAQSFAIFPGVSRSGATISTALFLGWDKKDAAKFSFLLGLPAISLAAISEFFSSIDNYLLFPLMPLIIGVLSSFVTSLVAIKFLIKHLSSKGLRYFVFYRVIFGIIIIINL